MKYRKTGFTIVELLTVLAVISLLIGVLIPALNAARNAGRVAKQKVQLTAIEQALFAFRNDYGDYPPSVADTAVPPAYGGAQKLAEALLGRDLLGFHPLSGWTANGMNPTLPAGQQSVYDSTNSVYFAQRKPRYLELETANAFTLEQVYYPSLPGRGDYVLCDSFGWKRVTVGTKSVNVGMPILYYQANQSGIGLISQLRQIADSTYRYTDNYDLANVSPNAWTAESFVSFVTDPKVQMPAGSWPWPYRPDSYILISAGVDGLYGTGDDITNFGY